MSKKQFFDKAIVNLKSQFQFKGGQSSCTYCSIESSIYLLQGLIFHDDPSIHGTIDKITQTGVSFDKQLGHRSTDEVFSYIDRYKQQLELGEIFNGRIKKEGFGSFLQTIKKVAKKRNEKTSGVVFTSKGETIFIYYNKDKLSDLYEFVVFDSHPRIFNSKKCGSGFYFFKDEKKLNDHLVQLYPFISREEMGITKSKELNLKEEMQIKKYCSYEANFVRIREKINFLSASTFESNKDKFEINTKPKERDFLTSVVISPVKKPKKEPFKEEKSTSEPNDPSTLLSIINTLKKKIDVQNQTIEEYKKKNAELKEENENIKKNSSKNLETLKNLKKMFENLTIKEI